MMKKYLAVFILAFSSPALAADFTYSTKDADQLAGIEYARALYCASQSAPCTTPDVASYWAFVAQNAFASYAADALRAGAKAQADAVISPKVEAIEASRAK